MIRHRGTCEADDCVWVRRENCEHCLRELADKHKAETGHTVHLTITADPDESGWELRQLARRTHQVLRYQRQRFGSGD